CFCFSYTPLDDYAVHNANLLGASLLLRLYHLTGERAFREASLAALAYTMKYQHQDGSWFYSETTYAHWVDSFHTGFNLESIRRFIRAGDGREYIQHYNRGVQFYAKNFFLSDGAPKYYARSSYPFDIHSAAEAIAFFADEEEHWRRLTDRVLAWTMR